MPTPSDPKPHSRSTAPFSVARQVARFVAVRTATDRLCDSLETDDYQITAAGTMPVKWHLAHTTWFFEKYVLIPHVDGYKARFARAEEMFESEHPNAGCFSRPTAADVSKYRTAVDEALQRWLSEKGGDVPAEADQALEMGMNHEQLHQEQLLADLKRAFSQNPMRPAFAPKAASPKPGSQLVPGRWLEFHAGLVSIGSSDVGFAFDSERPRHDAFVRPFAVASRLVTVGEYRAFLSDGGYDKPALWSPDGWEVRHNSGWTAPEYWQKNGDVWEAFTLKGQRILADTEPVTHVSYYEAEAFARWAESRLPTEQEWEVMAAKADPNTGNFAESGVFHPLPADPNRSSATQVFGDCWEWTTSRYVRYPGHSKPGKAYFEFDGRFPNDRFVIRGGSCITPRGFVRATSRFTAALASRIPFTGIRLAKDA